MVCRRMSMSNQMRRGLAREPNTPAIGDPARSRVDVTPGGEPGRVGRDGVSGILADEHDVTQPCDMARE